MNYFTDEEIAKINENFKANNAYYDVSVDPTFPIIKVNVERGDWKHDHGFCDWVMEKLGYRKLRVVTTYSDGSDCYSAVHWFTSDAMYRLFNGD